MAAEYYAYTYKPINADQLTSEVNAAGLPLVAFGGVCAVGTLYVQFIMTTTLTAPQTTTLTNTYNAHVPGPPTQPPSLGPTVGGTGQSAYATGDLLYASAANTLARRPAGSATHVLTMVGGVPAWVQPFVPSSNSATLASNYNITAANGVWANTGLEIALPIPGTYAVLADVRAALNSATTDTFLLTRLYNVTTAAVVPNSERLPVYAQQAGITMQTASSITCLVEATSYNLIRLEASRNGGASYTLSGIFSDANGKTTIKHFKIQV